MDWTAAQSLQYVTAPTGNATALQLAQAWQAAGGSTDPQIWTTAVAIGLAEQGGDAFGINADPPGASAGAWQIHYDNWGGLSNAGIINSPTDLENLTTNANAAIYISGNGGNFSPWTTYTGGAYLGHWQDAANAVAQQSGKPPVSPTGPTGVPTGAAGTGISLAVSLTGNLFNQYASLLKVLDPFALALIVVSGLLVFAFMGWSNKFASYAAIVIFLLLMIHSSATNGATPNGTSSASIPPASQITQPKVSYTNTVTQQSGGSGGSGGGDPGILGIASLLGFI